MTNTPTPHDATADPQQPHSPDQRPRTALPRVFVAPPRSRGLVERCCELQAALGYPTRMKMIKVLGSHRKAPLSVSEVAQTLRISQPTATKHLGILHRAGWVIRDAAGPRVHYLLNLDTVAEYQRLLALAFEHALTPCVNSFECTTCPFEETCV